MEFMYYFLLFLFGTILWSFSSVIIYRLRTWEKGIFMGRSKCPKCENTLGAKDLVPIFSYMFSKWKCRYCKTKVSVYYPALELSLGILFMLIWYFLIDPQLLLSPNLFDFMLLEFWLFVGFFVFIYTVYDILYLEIPENILAILVIWIFGVLWVHSIYPELYNTWMLSVTQWWSNIVNIGAILFSAVSIGLLYYIMLWGLDEKYDVLIFLSIIGWLLWIKYWFWIELTALPMFSALIWVLCIFWFFLAQILVSKGKWMWAGDLRIAIVLGLLVGYSYWIPALMLTYFSGSIIWVGMIVYSKFIKKEKHFQSQIPFWPFLTIGLFLTLFFQNEIDTIISSYFIL
jgi:prepilin signal peptidase PulO-like enzyme (type II secretory pathway)